MLENLKFLVKLELLNLVFGSGKLVLTNDADIKLNDVTLSGLKTYITNDGTTGKLDKVVLDWVVDKDKFVTQDSELAMPGFESG